MQHPSAQDEKVKDAVDVRVPLVHDVCLRRRARPSPSIRSPAGAERTGEREPAHQEVQGNGDGTDSPPHEKLLANTDDGQRPDDPEEQVPPGPRRLTNAKGV